MGHTLCTHSRVFERATPALLRVQAQDFGGRCQDQPIGGAAWKKIWLLRIDERAREMIDWEWLALVSQLPRPVLVKIGEPVEHVDEHLQTCLGD